MKNSANRRRGLLLPALAIALVGGPALISRGQPGGTAGGPRKLALLIGIDKYKDPAIPTLSGCVNDAANWEDVLLRKFGFAKADILKLTNAQATKAAVKEAFQKHLVAQATADTVVVIAVSSHGSQVFDESGDETTDGLDETFVLYDSNIRTDQGPHNQLIDDEVGALIADLNRKTQHVVLVADSCFSGTVTRAAGRTRAVPVNEHDLKLAEERGARTRSFDQDARESIKAPQGGPNYVLISAARSTEEAHEKLVDGQTNGALTWFLTSALRKSEGQSTYNDVFEAVKHEVTAAFPSQHPEIEGAEQASVFFGLKPAASDAYLAIKSTQGNVLTLAGGRAHGVTVGSKYGVFAPGTKSAKGATPLATAEVKSVDLLSSRAALASDIAVPAGARAFLTTQVVPVERTKLYIPATPAVLGKIREEVKSNPAVELIDQPSGYDLRVSSDSAQRLILEGGSLQPITDPIPASHPEAVSLMVSRIKTWVRWYNVRNLSRDTTGPKVSFKLVRLGTKAATSDGNLNRLVVGERFELQAQNLSQETLHFNVLDLSSTGSISMVYPRGNQEAVLAPGQKWQAAFTTTVKDGFDYDRDTAKLVVSTRPIDLSFLEQDAPATTRGGLTSTLAQLVGSTAYGSGTRGFAFADDGAEQWATRQVVFEIQPQVTAEESNLISNCYKNLSKLGLKWKKAKPMRGVVDPVELEPEVAGLTFRTHKGEARKLYMSCLFAQQVARFAKEAVTLGVSEVRHMGIYNYRCIGGGTPDDRACKVSQHAFGRAIDLESFKTNSGLMVVKSDWTKRPQPTCGAQGGTDKDKFLRDIACTAAKKAGFSIFLTPNYNAAHRDHFHADATPGIGDTHIRGVGSTSPAGTDPQDPALGD
jgi:hypothetical protein